MLKSRHPLELLIRKLEAHAELSEEDRQAILDLPFTRRMLEPATYTIREGDRPDRCSVLVSGFAYRQKLTGEGARQMLCTFRARRWISSTCSSMSRTTMFRC
jgi:hypothetical protein